MKTIAVVGSSNTDMIVRTDRIPAPGETLLGGTFDRAQGGKGANQAVAVARLGGRVSFVARVGKDAFGMECLAAFKREKMDVDGVIVDAKAPSGVALITVAKNSQNSIVVAPGANDALCKNDIVRFRKKIESASVVVLQLENPLATVTAAAQMARKAGVPVILNPAPAQTLPRTLLQCVDFLTPNEHEAALLSGVATTHTKGAEKAAEKLLSMGVKTVIVTLGSRGVLCLNRECMIFQPSFKVQAVDTTAAGDTFNGALAVALSEGQSLSSALRFACGAAALSVTRPGAQPSIPTRVALETFLKKNR